MHARQAHTLQQHALASLGQLRSWLGTQEATQAPAPAGQPSSYAAYAAWAAQVDAAIRAVSKAFPECERPQPARQAVEGTEPEPESVPPTLPSRGNPLAGHRLPPTSSDAPASER